MVTECWRLKGGERKKQREAGEIEEKRDGAKDVQREEESWVQRGSQMSATIALLLLTVHLPAPPPSLFPLPLPRASVRARACGVHDPNFFWLCVLPVVFLLIIQSEARCLQLSQGRERG